MLDVQLPSSFRPWPSSRRTPPWRQKGYYRPVQLPGVTADKRYSTCYGFNFVINASAPRDKQEVLHDMYRFVMSDLVDCWQATAPFTLARKSGWTDDPRGEELPPHPGNHPCQGQRRVPSRGHRCGMSWPIHAPRGPEGHAQQRGHQGGPGRGGGQGRPGDGGVQEES